MSKKLPENPQSEEVDLGQLFKLIGNLFDRLYQFIQSKFEFVFSILIFSIKAVIDNFKLIVLCMVIAGALGYGLEKIKRDVFTSQMLVKPYFDSKFQLVTNINYYNALIEDKDYVQLDELFEMDGMSEQLIEFEIKPGPETENDRILQYEKFIGAIDSIRAQDISFDDFIESRSIYSGSIFEINVKSFSKNIFKPLEEGLNKTFLNEYSVKKKKKSDSLIGLDKQRILTSLTQIDSLKSVYLEVMRNESNSNSNQVTLKDGMSLVQERVQTKEFELLDKELVLRTALNRLESQKVEEDTYFETIASFQTVGAKDSSFLNKYSLIFPVITFILLCFIYLTNKLVFYVKAYKI
ncbi:MAG: hypothetical protein ABJL44_18595 [Algibacter sp.]